MDLLTGVECRLNGLRVGDDAYVWWRGGRLYVFVYGPDGETVERWLLTVALVSDLTTKTTTK